ncbi:hypothetical protein LTR65_005758 [Meristemomyces frigidus]
MSGRRNSFEETYERMSEYRDAAEEMELAVQAGVDKFVDTCAARGTVNGGTTSDGGLDEELLAELERMVDEGADEAMVGFEPTIPHPLMPRFPKKVAVASLEASRGEGRPQDLSVNDRIGRCGEKYFAEREAERMRR